MSSSARAPVERVSLDFEVLFDALPLGAMYVSPSRVVERVNPALLDMFGMSADELVGRSTRNLFASPEDFDATHHHWAGADASNPIVRFEYWMRRKSGQAFRVQGTSRLVSDCTGAPLGFLGILRDVESERIAEEALAAAHRKIAADASMLAEQARRKDDFLATLSHELRNPLSPIVTALAVLSEGEHGAVSRRCMDVIKRQVGKLGRLVDDLLDVSRINRGKTELRKEHIELRSIIERSTETAQPLIDTHRHTVLMAIEPGLWLHADPVRLEQVVGNLIHNAAKYTKRGGLIEISAMREGDEVVMRVRDSGIGIAPEAIENIFDMFQQCGSPEHSEGGLGIGLTLVRGLVELHGGTITATSEGPNQGSTFEVRLPAA